jgi:hypothetical protein
VRALHGGSPGAPQVPGWPLVERCPRLGSRRPAGSRCRRCRLAGSCAGAHPMSPANSAASFGMREDVAELSARSGSTPRRGSAVGLSRASIVGPMYRPSPNGTMPLPVAPPAPTTPERPRPCRSVRVGEAQVDLEPALTVGYDCLAGCAVAVSFCCDNEVLASGAHRRGELADSLTVEADLDRVGALVLAA